MGGGEFGCAVQGGGFGWVALGDLFVEQAVLGLGTKTDEMFAAGAAREFHEVDGRMEILRDLGWIVAELVFYAMPGGVNDCVGREIFDGCGGKILDGSRHDCDVFGKRIDAPQIGAGPDQKTDLHILAREAVDQMGAEEAGGACDEYFHRRYCG